MARNVPVGPLGAGGGAGFAGAGAAGAGAAGAGFAGAGAAGAGAAGAGAAGAGASSLAQPPSTRPIASMTVNEIKSNFFTFILLKSIGFVINYSTSFFLSPPYNLNLGFPHYVP